MAIKILVLDRGWVLVGNCFDGKDEILLKEGSTILRWGTKEGLGELAKNGKLENTILNAFNEDVLINKKYIMMTIECNQDKWS